MVFDREKGAVLIGSLLRLEQGIGEVDITRREERKTYINGSSSALDKSALY